MVNFFDKGNGSKKFFSGKMKKIIKILFIIFFINYFFTFGNEKVDIVLKDKVIVFGSVITLGEIADIKCADEKLRESLSEIVIANSPIPLKSRIIKKIYIFNRLKHNRFDVDNMTLSGSEKVIISIDVKEISEKEIFEFVLNYLENKLPYRPEEREIVIKKRIANIFVPSRELHLEIIERRIGIMKGTFQVNVGIYNGERLNKSILVPVKVRTFENVVSAKEGIGGGSVIGKEDLIVERKETTTLGNKIIYNIDDAIGKKAKISIKKGDVLKSNILENVPVIQRGEFVTIAVSKGDVFVKAPGKAMQDGNMDDFIRVLNLSSNENIIAQVNGNSLVIIK